MYADVIVSTSGYLDLGSAAFRVSCHDREHREPFVVLGVGDLLTVHFGDPAVLARFAAAVAEAQQLLDTALLLLRPVAVSVLPDEIGA